MEKLRPILEQKFWILSAVALLLVGSGWWLGTGSLLAEYTQRESELAQLQNDLNQRRGNSVNSDCVIHVKEIYDTKESNLKDSRYNLIVQQKKARYWPIKMTRDADGKIFTESNLNAEDLDSYNYHYNSTIKTMQKIVSPYDLETGTGKCELKIDTIPRVDPGKWSGVTPSSSEVLNAQTDVWLISALLRAVADTNRYATGIGDAPLKVIAKLALHGGRRNPDGTPYTGRSTTNNDGEEGEFGGGGGDDAPAFDDSNVFEPGDGGGKAAGGGSGLTKSGVDFDVSVEFGSPTNATSGGGNEEEQYEDEFDQDSEEGGPEGGNQLTKSVERRYVDDDPKMPFKTRGFYLKVVMDRTKLAEFLVELTSLKYPVEIMRVHQASLDGKSHSSDTQSFGGGDRPFDNEAPDPFGGAPMGNGGPMPMGKGTPFAPRTTIKLTTQQEKAKETYSRALSDPNLSEVVIVGLMTIYTPKEIKTNENTTE